MGQPSDSNHTPSPGTETPTDNGTPPKPNEDMGKLLLGAKGTPTGSTTELPEDVKVVVETAEKRVKDTQAKYTEGQKKIAEQAKLIEELRNSEKTEEGDSGNNTELSDEAKELLEDTPGMKELLDAHKPTAANPTVTKEDLLEAIQESDKAKDEALRNAEKVKKEKDEAVKRDKEWREAINKEVPNGSDIVDDPEFLDWVQNNPNQLDAIRKDFEDSDPNCPIEIIKTFLGNRERVGGLTQVQSRNVQLASGRSRTIPTSHGSPKGSSSWGEAVAKAKAKNKR